MTRASGAGALLATLVATACSASVGDPLEGDPGDPGDSGGNVGGGDDGSGGDDDGATPAPRSSCRHPFLPAVSAFEKIYDPSDGAAAAEYINDHTIVKGADGTWHLFGITHAEPANPADETSFAHATAASLKGPWQKQEPALTADAGLDEAAIWAPHVVDNTASDGMYYMFYTAASSASGSSYRMRLATSNDLITWTKRPAALFVDGYAARDPYVVKIDGTWTMYYTATTTTSGGNHIVAYRTSTDLLAWSAKGVAYVDPTTGTGGGPTESSVVLPYEGSYYLFIGPRSGYVGTEVFRSDDPYDFRIADRVATFESHAAEVVHDDDGAWYVTHAGWAQGGVWLAPLEWRATSCEVLEGEGYRAAVQTAPFVSLSSFAIRGTGDAWRELLGTAERPGTGPYLGLGGFGDRCRAGAPASVEVDAAGGKVALRGIKMCGEPVALDWTFCARPDGLDTALAWTVDGALSANVYEVSFGIESATGALVDDGGPRAGNVAGFARWTAASAPDGALVAAYRDGSAWAEKNRWFDPASLALAWQTMWATAGAAWPAGTYAGGQWRLGGADQPANGGVAEQLTGAVNQPDAVCAP